MTDKRNISPEIIITLNYNQNNYQFNTEIIKPLNTFYYEVCNYLQINPSEYNLYYNKTKLPINNNNDNVYSLSSVIGQDKEPFFKIVSKKTKTPKKMNLRYDTIPSKEPDSFSSSKKPNILTFSTKNLQPIIRSNSIGVIISQIPSIKDMNTILNNFNSRQSNNNSKGILTAIDQNSVRADFQDERVLNEFISYVSFIKYEKDSFKNIIIQKDNSGLKKRQKNLSLSNNNVRSYLYNFNKKYHFNNNMNTLENERHNIKINDVIKALKQNELNHDTYHGLSLKRDGEDEIVTDYYKQQNFLRNSSPYISEDEKRILEEKENKKHFYDQHKNFVTSVGKYSMKPNFIPNYVGMTPSENPKTHVFRNEDKKKWITNKGFNV
jgi:hypothetical protein